MIESVAGRGQEGMVGAGGCTPAAMLWRKVLRKRCYAVIVPPFL